MWTSHQAYLEAPYAARDAAGEASELAEDARWAELAGVRAKTAERFAATLISVLEDAYSFVSRDDDDRAAARAAALAFLTQCSFEAENQIAVLERTVLRWDWED